MAPSVPVIKSEVIMNEQIAQQVLSKCLELLRTENIAGKYKSLIPIKYADKIRLTDEEFEFIKTYKGRIK